MKDFWRYGPHKTKYSPTPGTRAAQIIIERRFSEGFLLRDFVKQIGICKSDFNKRLIRPKNPNPHLQTMLKIREFFGVPFDAWLEPPLSPILTHAQISTLPRTGAQI